MYYYGARYYDPRTSVWQSPDPILEKYMGGKPNGGVYNPNNLKLFTYTYNNPVNLTDPTGEFVQFIPVILAFTAYANAPDHNDELKSGATPLAVIPVARAVSAGSALKTANVAESMAKSKIFGLGSKLFGNKFARGEPGKLNIPGKMFKIGWSGTAKNGGGSVVRIGIGRNPLNPKQASTHFNIPGTFVPDKVANKIMTQQRTQNGLK